VKSIIEWRGLVFKHEGKTPFGEDIWWATEAPMPIHIKHEVDQWTLNVGSFVKMSSWGSTLEEALSNADKFIDESIALFNWINTQSK
jgi:predicted RNase H-like HicB family nuclease